MARASEFQRTLVGVETVIGTPVAATKLLPLTSFAMTPQSEHQEFRPDGTRHFTMATTNKQWTVWNVAADILGYNDICYLLSCFVDYAAPVETTATYAWTFEDDQECQNTSKSLTLLYGDDGCTSTDQSAGAQLADWSMTFNRTGVSGTGSMIASHFTHDDSPSTVTVAKVAAAPVLPQQVSLYFASAQSGLAGATAETAAFEATISYSGKRAPLFTLDADNGQAYSSLIETAGDATINFKVEADSNATQFLDMLDDGQEMMFCRIEAVGPLITGAIYYKMTVDCGFMINSSIAPGDEGGIVDTMQFGGRIVVDDTWGKALSIIVINELSAL